MDMKKIEAIRTWPRPTTVTSVRSFIGMASYYRRFIKDFPHIAAPLNEATAGTKSKNEVVVWTPACEEVFQKLKQCLTTAPILQDYDPTKPVIIETDVSNFAIGATLLQGDEKGSTLRPVAYFSRKLKDAQKNCAANERELLAIVEALKEWRCYVEGLPIPIRTDHKPLIYAQNKKEIPPRLLKWIEELQHYQPTIEYKQGKENVLTDALSRRNDWKESKS